MIKELYEIIEENNKAIAKLEKLNETENAQIMQMIRDRQTHETRYQTLRINRAERQGRIGAFLNVNDRVKAILASNDA